MKLILLLAVISFFSCKKEEEKIMKVRNDSISDVSYTTARAFATIIDPGEGIEQHGHCWSTNAESVLAGNENTTEYGSVNSSGPYHSTLTNLSPGESYYVKAYIMYGITYIYSDNTRSFTTLSMGSPVVATGAVTNITTSTATVSATLDSLGSGASTVTQHGHCLSSETTTPTIDDIKTSLGSRNSIGDYESQLVSLSVNTLYYVRAYATNDAGTAYGDTVIFTTLDGINAEFSANPTSGYMPLIVQFTDMSSGEISSWSWDCGDGGTSAYQNQSHTYNKNIL